MASDMLLVGADEVARNGAFGKILRPEVFPDAPLQIFRLSTRCIPPSFPVPPPRILLKKRASREAGGVPRDLESLPTEPLRQVQAAPARRYRLAAIAWRPPRPSSARRRTAPAPSAPSRRTVYAGCHKPPGHCQ